MKPSVPTVLKLDELFPGHTISLSQVLHYLLSFNKCKAMCYQHWKPYLVYQYIQEEKYLTESHGLLSSLKFTAIDVPPVVHHLGSIEMWSNLNDGDNLEPEDDWYPSDTQESFLNFEEECQLSVALNAVG